MLWIIKLVSYLQKNINESSSNKYRLKQIKYSLDLIKKFPKELLLFYSKIIFNILYASSGNVIEYNPILSYFKSFLLGIKILLIILINNLLRF